ncbi:MAG: dihydropteroate synthase [Thermodesulfobacteriota bacterium]
MRPPIRCLEIRSAEEARSEMELVGADPVGIKLMAPKQLHQNIKVEALTPAQANILKQDILAVGGDAAVSKGTVSCRVGTTDAILSGTRKQIKLLIKKLRLQPYDLPALAKQLGDVLANTERGKLTLKGRSGSWTLGERTLVMGILNVTPDSFSDGGLYLEEEKAVRRAREMAGEGADFIDVGGESTRPGAAPVDEAEEVKRVIPVVRALAKEGMAVSVDTTRAAVAREALEEGAEMINDVSALEGDPEMAGVVAESGAAVVLMHMRGTPRNMQENVGYRDMMGEIFNYLRERLDYAESSGIGAESTVIDPGIGFGKSAAGNMEIIKRLGELKALGRPILLGSSRKSFIGKTLGTANGRNLAGTLATVTAAVLNGAHIVRVHDVGEAREAAAMATALRSAPRKPDA